MQIKKKKSVNVLGVPYTITVTTEQDDPRLTDADGCCDDSTREILVEDFKAHRQDPNSKADLDVSFKKVLRHEIVHAFLSESGLADNSDWAKNEEAVDWIALQGPKIYKAWQEVGAL